MRAVNQRRWKGFDLQLEEDGIAKSMGLYKERMFAKLRYSAAVIPDYIKQYKKILQNNI